MTDQSRVAAVARGMFPNKGPDDPVWQAILKQAEDAIYANDAWLEEQAKLTPKYCPKCGHPHGQRMVWAEEVDR